MILPTNGCSLELCIPFPLLLRTNNMHVLLAARQSYFSLHMPPKTRFPEYGSLLLIGQFKERNAELEWAAVSGEDRCVTNLITAAKETTWVGLIFFWDQWTCRCMETSALHRRINRSVSPINRAFSHKVMKFLNPKLISHQSCYPHQA